MERHFRCCRTGAPACAAGCNRRRALMIAGASQYVDDLILQRTVKEAIAVMIAVLIRIIVVKPSLDRFC